MNAKTRNLILGGALLLGGAFTSFYFYRKNQAQKAFAKEFKPVPRDIIIRIMREEKRELFPVIRYVAQTAKQAVEESNGELTYDVFKRFLLTNNTLIIDKVRDISKNLYEKYGIEEKDMLYACQITYAKDQEIQALLVQSRTSFDSAFEGILPDPTTTIPEFLTQERVLEIRAKLMKDTLLNAQKLVQGLTSQGLSLSANKQIYLYGLQEIKLNNTERKVLINEGLDGFEDAPEKIFDFALEKYEKENAEFKHKIDDLDYQNAIASEAVMANRADANELIEAIGTPQIPHTQGSAVEEPKESVEEVLEDIIVQEVQKEIAIEEAQHEDAKKEENEEDQE